MTFEELISTQIRKPDAQIYTEAKAGWDAVAKPIDGLGDLEEILCRIASAAGSICPDISEKALVIMCADNGVVAEGVSQSGQSVTSRVAGLMGEGRSSAGAMCRSYPADILPVDVGINSDEVIPGVLQKKVRKGTRDIARESAMTAAECLEAVRTGIEVAEYCRAKGYGILAAGEMGIGNTTTAAALLSALTGEDPALITGKGAGLPEEGLKRKIQVIRDALQLHLGEITAENSLRQGVGHPVDVRLAPTEAEHRAGDAQQKAPIALHTPASGLPATARMVSPEDTFECLRRLGGLDIAAMAGLFIGGAAQGLPVVIDGLISAVAALAAERIVPGCREYMIASHSGREKGTMEALKRLALKPVICADLALGEGTGAILLFPILDMAMSLYRNGTAFADSGIEPYRRFGESGTS